MDLLQEAALQRVAMCLVPLQEYSPDLLLQAPTGLPGPQVLAPQDAFPAMGNLAVA